VPRCRRTTAIIDAPRYVTGTPSTTEAQAFYIEDNWNVTPNLLLNLGAARRQVPQQARLGATFAKADFSDMISPRVGFSWDVKGDGTTKVFGNAGRYYLPLTNKLADYFGGGTTDEHTYYVLNGWSQQTDPNRQHYYLSRSRRADRPGLHRRQRAGPDDVRTEVARDLKMVFQDEYILGFQRRSTAPGPMASTRPTAR
jgi:hypothetical protein